MATRLCACVPRVLGQHTADLGAFQRLVMLSACISIRTCNRLFKVAVKVVGFRFLFLSEWLGLCPVTEQGPQISSMNIWSLYTSTFIMVFVTKMN